MFYFVKSVTNANGQSTIIVRLPSMDATDENIEYEKSVSKKKTRFSDAELHSGSSFVDEEERDLSQYIFIIIFFDFFFFNGQTLNIYSF